MKKMAILKTVPALRREPKASALRAGETARMGACGHRCALWGEQIFRKYGVSGDYGLEPADLVFLNSVLAASPDRTKEKNGFSLICRLFFANYNQDIRIFRYRLQGRAQEKKMSHPLERSAGAAGFAGRRLGERGSRERRRGEAGDACRSGQWERKLEGSSGKADENESPAILNGPGIFQNIYRTAGGARKTEPEAHGTETQAEGERPGRGYTEITTLEYRLEILRRMEAFPAEFETVKAALAETETAELRPEAFPAETKAPGSLADPMGIGRRNGGGLELSLAIRHLEGQFWQERFRGKTAGGLSGVGTPNKPTGMPHLGLTAWTKRLITYEESVCSGPMSMPVERNPVQRPVKGGAAAFFIPSVKLILSYAAVRLMLYGSWAPALGAGLLAPPARFEQNVDLPYLGTSLHWAEVKLSGGLRPPAYLTPFNPAAGLQLPGSPAREQRPGASADLTFLALEAGRGGPSAWALRLGLPANSGLPGPVAALSSGASAGAGSYGQSVKVVSRVNFAETILAGPAIWTGGQAAGIVPDSLLLGEVFHRTPEWIGSLGKPAGRLQFGPFADKVFRSIPARSGTSVRSVSIMPGSPFAGKVFYSTLVWEKAPGRPASIMPFGSLAGVAFSSVPARPEGTVRSADIMPGNSLVDKIFRSAAARPATPEQYAGITPFSPFEGKGYGGTSVWAEAPDQHTSIMPGSPFVGKVFHSTPVWTEAPGRPAGIMTGRPFMGIALCSVPARPDGSGQLADILPGNSFVDQVIRSAAARPASPEPYGGMTQYSPFADTVFRRAPVRPFGPDQSASIVQDSPRQDQIFLGMPSKAKRSGLSARIIPYAHFVGMKFSKLPVRLIASGLRKWPEQSGDSISRSSDADKKIIGLPPWMGAAGQSANEFLGSAFVEMAYIGLLTWARRPWTAGIRFRRLSTAILQPHGLPAGEQKRVQTSEFMPYISLVGIIRPTALVRAAVLVRGDNTNRLTDRYPFKRPAGGGLRYLPPGQRRPEPQAQATPLGLPPPGLLPPGLPPPGLPPPGPLPPSGSLPPGLLLPGLPPPGPLPPGLPPPGLLLSGPLPPAISPDPMSPTGRTPMDLTAGNYWNFLYSYRDMSLQSRCFYHRLICSGLSLDTRSGRPSDQMPFKSLAEPFGTIIAAGLQPFVLSAHPVRPFSWQFGDPPDSVRPFSEAGPVPAVHSRPAKQSVPEWRGLSALPEILLHMVRPWNLQPLSRNRPAPSHRSISGPEDYFLRNMRRAAKQWPAKMWPAERWPAKQWPAKQWPAERWPAKQWPAEQWPAKWTAVSRILWAHARFRPLAKPWEIKPLVRKAGSAAPRPESLFPPLPEQTCPAEPIPHSRQFRPAAEPVLPTPASISYSPLADLVFLRPPGVESERGEAATQVPAAVCDLGDPFARYNAYNEAHGQGGRAQGDGERAGRRERPLEQEYREVQILREKLTQQEKLVERLEKGQTVIQERLRQVMGSGKLSADVLRQLRREVSMEKKRFGIE